MKKLTMTIATAAIVLGLGSAASAQGYSGDAENPAAVESAVPAAPAAPAAPAPAVETQAAAQQLPVTGGEATGLAVLGSALVAGGGVLVWRSRSVEVA